MKIIIKEGDNSLTRLTIHDQSLTLEELVSVFPAATGLKYQDADDPVLGVVTLRDNTFIAPANGWDLTGRVYLVVYGSKKGGFRSFLKLKQKKTQETADKKSHETVGGSSSSTASSIGKIVVGIGDWEQGKKMIKFKRRTTSSSRYVGGTVSVHPVDKYTSQSDEICRLGVLSFSEQNRNLFNSNITYHLCYPDGSPVGNTLPDNKTPFSLASYKSYKGVPYDRLRLYICPTTSTALQRNPKAKNIVEFSDDSDNLDYGQEHDRIIPSSKVKQFKPPSQYLNFSSDDDDFQMCTKSSKKTMNKSDAKILMKKCENRSKHITVKEINSQPQNVHETVSSISAAQEVGFNRVGANTLRHSCNFECHNVCEPAYVPHSCVSHPPYRCHLTAYSQNIQAQLWGKSTLLNGCCMSGSSTVCSSTKQYTNLQHQSKVPMREQVLPGTSNVQPSRVKPPVVPVAANDSPPRKFQVIDMDNINMFGRTVYKKPEKFKIQQLHISEIPSSTKLSLSWSEEQDLLLLVDPTSFSSGGMRDAYLATVLRGPTYISENKMYVLKLHQKVLLDAYGYAYGSIEAQRLVEKEVQTQSFAQMMSAEYTNASKRCQDPWQIRVIPVYKATGPSGKHFTLEECLYGKWEKYNNNDGTQMEASVTGDMINSFSHWSLEQTNYTATVLDMQGVGCNISDVEVASKDKQLFGIGNLGEEAINKFAQTHLCSDFCRKLGLQTIKDMYKVPDVQVDSQEKDIIDLTCNSYDSLQTLPSLTDDDDDGDHYDGDDGDDNDDLAESSNNNTWKCCVCLNMCRGQGGSLIPCGHSQFCLPCCIRLKEDKCPVCREYIADILKIYM